MPVKSVWGNCRRLGKRKEKVGKEGPEGSTADFKWSSVCENEVPILRSAEWLKISKLVKTEYWKWTFSVTDF